MEKGRKKRKGQWSLVDQRSREIKTCGKAKLGRRKTDSGTPQKAEKARNRTSVTDNV